MFLCRRLESNAYRVLGVSPASTSVQIRNASAALRRAAILGNFSPECDCFGEIIRSEDSIRSALSDLGNVKERIQQRLLWFYGPVPIESSACVGPWPKRKAQEDAHDSVLRVLTVAYIYEDLPQIVTALREWKALMSKEVYWNSVAQIEAESGFEPAASPDELAMLQEKATALAAEPLVVPAKCAWAAQALPSFKDYLAALRQLEDTGEWVAASREDLLFPLTRRLAQACATLETKYRTQIVHRKDAVMANRLLCSAALHYFRQFVEPALHDITAVLEQDEEEALLARGETAEKLHSIALDHIEAAESETTEDLAAEAVTLAEGTAQENRLRVRLKKYLEAREERMRRGAYLAAEAALKNSLDIFDTKFGLSEAATGERAGQIAAMTDAALKFYRDFLEPPLMRLLDEFVCYREECMGWRVTGASRISRIAATFATAEEFSRAEDLLAEALGLAKDTDQAAVLHKELDRIRKEAARLQARREIEAVALEIIKQMHQHCRLLAGWGGRVREVPGYAAQNRQVADEELRFLDLQVTPKLERAIALLSPKDFRLRNLQDEVAYCLANIAIHHSWAGDGVTADALLARALQLVEDDKSDEISQTYEKRRAAAPLEQEEAPATEVSSPFAKRPVRQERTVTVKLPLLISHRWLVATALVVLFAVVVACLTGSRRTVAPPPGPITPPEHTSKKPPPEPPTEEPGPEVRILKLKIDREQRRAQQMERQLAPLKEEIESMQESATASAPSGSALEAKLEIYNRLLKREQVAVSKWKQDAGTYNQHLARNTPPATGKSTKESE